ncbi:transglutaminase-like cysteine peptidase [Sansalvadorimonas sp. 2012CJ34-2]|uniref:Transglutaminase-like cysteine peptidase n=1 Tax=Parendozoicomonas callyspongiae TaxID=2942213 RepID=A0ABT0PK98_9GAMM|nr:transglutaminase-like cysteine peptidase [Sansalvadorimonas sp. 2012CJ34-2]MCL6271784.1 transglutaminase-like cysteine peptidase [Sansalvadorimonas sp. 2012CJ34-2]
MKLTAVALAISIIGLTSTAAGAESLPVVQSVSSSQNQVEYRLDAWESLLQRLKSAAPGVLLEEVNSFFNSLTFRSDWKAWGKEDYWASPDEFLRRGIGDCEDYAIAKYVSLRRMGFDDRRLRLAYVRALNLGQAHMVLLVETEDGKQIVLDNLTSSLKSLSERSDLAPVYAFNGTDLWLLDKEYNERRIGQSSRLPHWKSLKNRSNHAIWPQSES